MLGNTNYLYTSYINIFLRHKQCASTHDFLVQTLNLELVTFYIKQDLLVIRSYVILKFNINHEVILEKKTSKKLIEKH